MNNKQTEQYLKKNRPNKVLPIINTCFGGVFLIGSIYCKIRYNDIYNEIFTSKAGYEVTIHLLSGGSGATTIEISVSSLLATLL